MVSSTQVLAPPLFTVPRALAVEGEEEGEHTPLLLEQPTEISMNPSDSEVQAEDRNQEEEVE